MRGLTLASRDDTPRLNGNSYPVTDSQRAGTIDHNSSYGTLPDGRILPHTVGPGNAVISAYSTHYMQTSVRDVLRVGCAVAEGPYGTGYWGVNTGTSMSCPFVAGYMRNLARGKSGADRARCGSASWN